jgi:hypothetical protein
LNGGWQSDEKRHCQAAAAKTEKRKWVVANGFPCSYSSGDKNGEDPTEFSKREAISMD